jgi:benzil reductase ((S)-benzoin forming)
MKAILTGHTRGLGAAIAANLLDRNIPVLGLARGRVPDADLLVQREIDLADPGALLDWLGGTGLSDFLAASKTVLLINNAGTVQPFGLLAL